MREDGGKPKRGGEEQMSFFEKLISLVTAVIGLVSSIITGLSQGFGLGIGLALGVGVVGFIVIRLSNDDPVMTPTPSATVAMPSNTNTPLPEFVITDISPHGYHHHPHPSSKLLHRRRQRLASCLLQTLRFQPKRSLNRSYQQWLHNRIYLSEQTRM